jgi:hypothetical protein
MRKCNSYCQTYCIQRLLLSWLLAINGFVIKYCAQLVVAPDLSFTKGTIGGDIGAIRILNHMEPSFPEK